MALSSQSAVGPLATWIAPQQLQVFLDRYLGREPLAAAQQARAHVSACTWDVLDEMLHARPDDLLVVAGGRNMELPPPRSLPELQTMFQVGMGVALRTAEAYSTRVRALCRQLALEIPGQQRVIAFATAAKTHGFGWHYDSEDVFILQTAGDKEYLFRRNTQVDVPSAPLRGQPDFTTFRHEVSPIMSCRLIAGDFLYLPRGYWHVAYAHADSLSLSIGIFPEHHSRDLGAQSAHSQG
jgi:50S ribosomal protein L16 3-hydroxylase